MSRPVILFDIGNTAAKTALWRAGTETLTVRRWDTTEMDYQIIPSLMADAKGAVLTSVVPAVSTRIRASFPHTGIPLVELDAEYCMKWGILSGLYPGIGADRIAHCIALSTNGELPAVCLDIGTAITIDRVTSGNRYDGGFIIPGPGLMAEALSSGTALVDLRAIEEGPFRLGTDTESAVRAGCWWAIVALIEGMFRLLERNGLSWERIVVTGGWASRLSPFLTIPHEQDSIHIFRGMMRLWDIYEKRIAGIDIDSRVGRNGRV